MTATDTLTGTPSYTAGTWAIDPVHSEVGFTVRHMMVSKVRGRFTSFSGEIVTGEDPLDSSVTAEIALDSIVTGQEQRDAHIRSADFFDVENHPTMTYRSTGVRAHGDGYVVDGQLTLRGREYVVSLKPCGRGILLETLRYADEVVKAQGYFRDIPDSKPDPEMLDLAETLIDKKTAKFDPKPEMQSRPSGVIWTECIISEWPFSVSKYRPVLRSHS